MKDNFSIIENLFTALPEDDDTEFVKVAITFDEMIIQREDTGIRRDNEGNEFPPFKGFLVGFTIKEAYRIRDFLNFSLREI